MNAINNPNHEQKKLTNFKMPLSSGLVKEVIKSFCFRPSKGDDSWETCSVGVAEDSLVATDGSSAILIGTPKPAHYATKRKDTLIECERAKQYNARVMVEMIHSNDDAETGNAKRMPDVCKVINDRMTNMQSVATMDPASLMAAAKVALAAGALSIELFQPLDDKGDSLGFKFEFPPDSSHINLFSEWEGDIKAVGVFMASQSERQMARAQVESEPSDEGAVKPPAEAPSVSLTVVENPVPVPTPEPEEIFDIHEQRISSDGLHLPLITALAPSPETEEWTPDHMTVIEDTFKRFGVVSKFIGYQRGPAVTQYQFEIPPNIKTSRITGMTDNLAMTLAVTNVRVEAPIPGKNAVGIEVPNQVRTTVSMREMVASSKFYDTSPLTVTVGKDIQGRPVYADLAKAPHLLIAGATNSGKSIAIASLITSLLMKNSPKDLRMVMIDPKRVELALFDRIPHLMCPVIKEVQEAPGVLRAVWREMERRYELLESKSVRNIVGWNDKSADDEKLSYIVVVIDELADLMMSAKAEVETSIVRLAQKARAVGIHLVVATQRPSVDVITGLIKANIPSRLGFAVASQVDSRVILDNPGAEQLLGAGDALFHPIDSTKPRRVQGAFVSEEEVEAICSHWRSVSPPNFTLKLEEPEEDDDKGESDGSDPLLLESIRFICERGQCSTSMLQRKFSIGFQRARGIIDTIYGLGMLSDRDGPKPRDVIMDEATALAALEKAGGNR